MEENISNPTLQEVDVSDELINHDSIKRDGLSRSHIWAYSVGHFCNDLCASQYAFFMTWYLTTVVKLDQHVAGLCLLSGQIADGFMTPLVGIYSDKFETKRCGKRMPWYIFGTIVVIPGFAGLFLYSNNDSKSSQYAVYMSLTALFNVGWAAVQISNMAIVNSLTYSNRRRDYLSNNRNGFTYLANITVLSIALFLFLTMDNAIAQFRVLSIISLILGLLTSLFYIYKL